MRAVKVDYIVTTACGDREAWSQKTPSRSKFIANRIEMLKDEILPAAVGFDSVIVVGRCHKDVELAHPDFTFLHLPPLIRDRVEAFRQREVASRWSNADILVVSADDHKLGEGFADKVRALDKEEWDIITPKRIHGITGEELNNGKEDGYHPWHCNVIRRSAWAMLPWTTIATLWCDIVLSRVHEELNFKTAWDMGLEVIDVEAAEDET